MDMNGRRVVVMGGSSGVGEATAALFASQGAEVVITGRNVEKLERAAKRIGGPVVTRTVDATAPEQLAAFFATTGEIDHLVLAVTGYAGGTGEGDFAAIDLADLRTGFEVKYWAHLQTLHAALPTMAKEGSVVFLTAASAQAALPGTAGAAAINGALEKMVPPLAIDLAPLRVNAVSPGLVDTPWWDYMPADQRAEFFRGIARILPVGRVGKPEDVAQAVFVMAVNPYITGTVLVCSGGGHLATADPRLFEDGPVGSQHAV